MADDRNLCARCIQEGPLRDWLEETGADGDCGFVAAHISVPCLSVDAFAEQANHWFQENYQPGGPTIEVASDNAGHDDGHYEMALPLGAPVKAPYVAGSVPLLFTPDAAVMGNYRLAATVARSSEVQFADIVLGATPVQRDFHFAAP